VNPDCKGFFLNEDEGDGWEARLYDVEYGPKWLPRWLWFREKQIFLFTLNTDTPLTFVQDNGDQLRPCRPGESFPFDFGSIPNWGQSIIHKEGPEYAYHDREYQVGYIWIKRFGSTWWEPIAVTRNQSDRLLRTQSQCTKHPRGKGKSGLIYGNVAAFGRFCGFTAAVPPFPPAYPVRPDPPDVDDILPMGVGS
jgi:hypothetical protein